MWGRGTAAEAPLGIVPPDAFLNLARAGQLGRDIPPAGERRLTAWDLLGEGGSNPGGGRREQARVYGVRETG